jgi:hypothetical protein
MCKRGPYFKLCTCDPKKLGDYNWRLHRGSSFEENTLMAVGGIGIPKNLRPDVFFEEQGFIIDRLLFDINNNPVFDFDYIPVNGDTLSLVVGEHIFLDLIYKNKRFEFIDDSVIANNDGSELGSGEIRYIP